MAQTPLHRLSPASSTSPACCCSCCFTPNSVLGIPDLSLAPSEAIESVPNLLEFDYDQEVALYPLEVHGDLLLLDLPYASRGDGEIDVERLLALCALPGPPTVNAESRIRGVLRIWHRAFGLAFPSTISLALQLLRRLLAAVGPFISADAKITRLSLAVCFWVAAKVDGLRKQVPRLADLEMYTTVQPHLLIHGEARLCKLLNWNLAPRED